MDVVFVSKVLYPDDDDIELVLQIMDYAIKQSKHAYEVISLKEGEMIQKKFTIGEMYDILPAEFNTADAVQLCMDNEVSRSCCYKWLSVLLEEGKID